MFKTNEVNLSEIIKLYPNRECSDSGYFDYIIIDSFGDKVRIEFKTGRNDYGIKTLEYINHTGFVIDRNADTEFIIQNFTYYNTDSCDRDIFAEMMVNIMYHKPKVNLDLDECYKFENVFTRYDEKSTPCKIYNLSVR